MYSWNSEQKLLWHKNASNGTCTDGSAAFVRHSERKDEDTAKALK